MFTGPFRRGKFRKDVDVQKLLRAMFLAGLAGFAGPGAAQMSAAPMISSLPDVKSISAGNAAGVLQYCLDNNLVSHSRSDTVLAPLLAKPDVSKSADFSAGKAGRILTKGKSFSLDETSSPLRSQACDMVLRRAQTLK